MTSHWVPFPRCSQLKRLWYSDQFTANDNNGDDNDEHTEKKKKKTENEITQADKYMFCRLHEPNENLQFMRSGIAVDFFCILAFISNVKTIMQYTIFLLL